MYQRECSRSPFPSGGSLRQHSPRCLNHSADDLARWQPSPAHPQGEHAIARIMDGSSCCNESVAWYMDHKQETARQKRCEVGAEGLVKIAGGQLTISLGLNSNPGGLITWLIRPKRIVRRQRGNGWMLRGAAAARAETASHDGSDELGSVASQMFARGIAIRK